MIPFFDITLRLKGFPIKQTNTLLEQIVNIPENEFQEYVEKQRTEILNYHLQNNSFYREFTGINEFKDWNDLPVMTKKDLQKPLKDRLSKDFNLKNVYINKTSGSSGDPFVFAKDKFCHSLTWSSNILRFGWHNINFNSSYQARFYGIPLDFVGYKKERIKDFLAYRYRFPIFDLSEAFMETILKKFQNSKFDYINGYTSSIVQFAKFLQQKNIILKEICPTLKSCVVTSEMLFEEDRKLLENQFGIPVINEYGASELDLIAFENTKGEWQVNSEVLFVEILDKNNQPVPHGQEGKVVITSLYNKAHPFIRYEIGDIGILDEKSTFKKPVLKKLLGRTNDFAKLPSGKTSPGLTFYYVTKSIIEDDGNVKEFIIKQKSINTFEIDYVSEYELTGIQIQQIEKAIETYLEGGLKFTFNRKDKLQRTTRGKLKQFVSELN